MDFFFEMTETSLPIITDVEEAKHVVEIEITAPVDSETKSGLQGGCIIA